MGSWWAACTIFVSAFLLFQVEPVIAKLILPWFGGSAAVWTTCLLFFQITLLLGYLYAHWTTGRCRPRTQAWIHAGLLGLSLLALPVVPGAGWRPGGGGNPILEILGLLAATVGLPYFMLSTTGPLVQAWTARRNPGAAPYRLYALSNIASMLALLSYPVLVEPFVPTRAQGRFWSWAYVAFAALALRTALGSLDAPPSPEEGPAPEAPPASAWALWALLPACASALLLAVTNHLTQNVAAIPFLWVLPLCLYLLTFIACFDRDAWYRPALFSALTVAAAGGMAYALLDFENLAIRPTIAVFLAGLLFACMVCHGELVRLKPHPRYLTGFYLMIALGGALGGLFVGVVAPTRFNGAYELPITLGACCVLAALRWWRLGLRRGLRWAGPAAALVITAALAWGVRDYIKDYRVLARNFYGGLRVRDSIEGGLPVRILTNGVIDHGEQYLTPGRRRYPTTYYGPDSGVGLALRSLERPGVRAGFIGLGAGTLAAYGRQGDAYRFYEINPLVMKLARTQFTFLTDCPAAVTCVLGDARLSLEREAPQQFDLLAVDAFSGDAIPVHLLTREAFRLYFRHLKQDGLLAVHISNRYLDLDPVVEQAARDQGKATLRVETEDDDDNDLCSATWVLVGEPERFRAPIFKDAGSDPKPWPGFRGWTDDYSNLLRVLK
jgi:hypothetical protein